MDNKPVCRECGAVAWHVCRDWSYLCEYCFDRRKKELRITKILEKNALDNYLRD